MDGTYQQPPNSKVSRRGFLVGATGAGLVATVGGTPLLRYFANAKNLEIAEMKETWVPSTTLT